ncbi:MAG: hypothetical protein KKH98_04030, partial [Spirochaetes bacterium]|nr:hypothetical protein [Spirochaetota bacterium]
MKKILLILFALFFINTLYATETRVKSLGDIENPVTGKISGLIKDDIVDIYFNPASVNDVKAFLILTSFYLKYGTDTDNITKDEKYEKIENNTVGKKSSTVYTTYDRRGYDLTLNTGVLIPLKFINIFMNYNPFWNKYQEDFTEDEYTFDQATSTLTNSFLKTHQNSYTESTLPFDVTIGFNMFDRIMLGFRTGYYSSRLEQSFTELDGTFSKKSEYNNNRFIIGAGLKFNFSQKIGLSLVTDLDLAQKDESPLLIEGGFAGAGNNNYDPLTKTYDYITTENETSINVRVIPEIDLSATGEKFIRIIVEANFIDYKKDFNFNEKGDLKSYEISDFTKNKLIGNLGFSYNHALSQTTKAVYGFKYSGLINGLNKYKFYEDKADKTTYINYREESRDHFLGLFMGFDIELTKYLFVRTGISQGVYRLSHLKIFNTTVIADQKDIVEANYIDQYFLPDSTFCLGFYI